MLRGSGTPRTILTKANAPSPKRRATHPKPTRRFELSLYRTGVQVVAGIDEVGRGCLAGPVLAAAVILPVGGSKLRSIAGVADSKVLTAEEREHLYERITRVAVWGVGLASHRMIDRYGIAPATRFAMAKAFGRLETHPEHLLIDAMRLPILNLPQTAIIDGDAICLSIAAASIVAKVTRDGLMKQAAIRYPDYGFESHKGYGTPQHHDALVALGPCPIHRLTFKPAFADRRLGEMTATDQ